MTNPMPEAETLMALAGTLEACAEDARRPECMLSSWPHSVGPTPRIISLANGLAAIAAALRSRASTLSEDTRS